MNYKEFIDNILKTRGRFGCGDEYHERHHIIPKCMNGTNDKENLIDLYAREHFIAHKLLAEENPDNNGLVYAWWMMAHVKDKNQERYLCTPEEYEEAKFINAKARSQAMKEWLSDPGNHPMYGKHPSEETLNKMSKAHSGENNYFYGVHMCEEKNSMFGRKHTEESNKKNSESNKANWTDDKRQSFGKSRMGAQNPHSKTIYQYDKNGNFIREWGSTMDAHRSLNIDSSGIAKCARGKYKTYGGFVWKYVFEN